MKKERPRRQWIPFVQIRSNAAIRYCVPDPPPEGGKFSKTTYSGKVTDGAARRIRRSVDLLVQLSPRQTVWNPISQSPISFRLTFITLTISARVLIPHTEAYKEGLRKFLDWMRRQEVNHFIWKAELQERGQIHYHLTTNRFLHMNDIRSAWNLLQKKAGWLNDWHETHGHWQPPSTEVKAVRNDAEIGKYLGKYIAKADPDGAKINGKVWGASRSLAAGKMFSVEAMSYNENALEAIAKATPENVTHLEACSIYRKAKAAQILDKQQFEQYREWLRSL